MISDYEIRENTLTQNSIFLLLLKADQQGCEDVKQGLSAFCKLIDYKIQGYDYVFELSGITDDSMLEKVKGRMEALSSPFRGTTQTFANALQTATFTVAENSSTELPQIKETETDMKKEYTPEDIFVKSSTDNLNNGQEQANAGGSLPVISLAKTGFSVDTKKEDTSFEGLEIDKNSPYTEQGISLKGESLKLVKTYTNLTQELPKIEEAQEPVIEPIPSQEELTPIEEENKTVVSFSPEELKNVSISIEHKKKGFLRNVFGKIKSAMKNKGNKKEEVELPKNTKEENVQQTSSDLLKKQNKTNSSKSINSVKSNKNSKQTPVQKEENPFQDLGEGILVKKSRLDAEEQSGKAQKNIKEEVASDNPINPQLQVDDIFDAETVCEFYAEQPENKKEEKNFSREEESPLEKLEKTGVQEKQNISLAKDNTVSELLEKPVSKKEALPEEEGLLENPSPIFTPKQERSKAENIGPKELPQSKENEKQEIKKENPKVAVKKEVKPEIKPQEVKEEKETKKVLKKETQQEKKENSFRIVSVKESRAISKTKEESSKPEEKLDDKSVEKDSQQGESGTNMQEQKRTMFTKTQSDIKSNSKGEKFDHTLHIATPSKETKYRNYPIEMPLIPTYTFANMDISSIRFAHAMAMVTLDNLGTTNNPFLLQGGSGTGKTHFLHAMGYEISKKIPQAKILYTNGVRLSRGIQYALERGKKDKLDEFFNNAEVLIVDDVHLTAVNEHNREYISKVLNDFLQNKKQIILSSKYPPESLKRFEELVNFKFSLGTIAEVKVPGKEHFAKLINKVVTGSFLNLTDNQIQEFFTGHNKSLGEVAMNVKRVKVLSRRIESSGIKKMSYEELLKVMTGVEGENQNSEIVKKDFSDVTSLEKTKETSWGSFGFFFPSSQIDKFRWVAFASQEAAKELGIKGGFNYALKSAYSTEHIISSAFKIANICDLKGLKGAVIVGPSLIECKEAIRNNFYDILSHMLEVMLIRCGTINFEDIKKPSAYIKMLGDILK